MNSSSTAHYRDLLRQLSEAQTERLNALYELAEFDTEQTRLLPQNLQEALRALDWEYEQAKSELDARHAQEMQVIEEDYRTEDSQAKMEYGRRLSEVDLRHDADVAAADQKHKESTWVVQSVLDESSENSPKVAHERYKSQLQQTKVSLNEAIQEVRTLFGDGTKLVQARWQRVGENPAPASLPRSREELEQTLRAAADDVRAASKKLRGQLIPRLFGNWLLLLPFILIFAGGLGGALFAFVQPQWVGLAAKLAPTEWAAISGGVALFLCLIVLFILYNVASSQTAHAFEPLQQRSIDAQACLARWQKVAEEEYRRADQDFRKRYAAMIAKRDKSLQEFDTEKETRTAELEKQRRDDLNAATQQRDAALKAASEKYRERRKTEETTYQTESKSLEKGWQQKRHQLTGEHEQELAERTKRRQGVLERCESRWKTALGELRSEEKQTAEDSRRQFPTWDAVNDSTWKHADEIPSALRLGDYQFHVPSPRKDLTPEQKDWVAVPDFRLPAVVPFPDSPSLVIKAAGPGRDEAVSLLQVGMLRFLDQLPPGDVRFTIFDPVGLGESFASFMHLADYDELLITNRIWTEPSQIEEQLAKLTEHMENVFQKYLRNEYDSLEEYNKQAGEIAEPYRVLIVANFPNGFTERAAQRLVSIASSGAKCGVHTLVSVDTQQHMPRDFDLSRLEESATVLEWKPDKEKSDTGQFLNPALGPVAPLVPDQLPNPALMASVVKKIGELSKDIRRVEVPFTRIAPREEEYWKADSRKGIEVPLGRSGATKLQYMKLGSGTSQHVLVAGKTGSGKSTLLHVVITDLALRYSPDEVEFYLIDFKKGVEFKTYASHGLPHAKVIAIESDREFGVSVLEKLDAVLKERGDLFRDAGAQDVKSFREARPDMKMPRILLMVDEFQEFFIEDDKYSQTASLLVDRLVRQGRAFGMHVMLGSQSLGGAYSLPRTTIGQMAVRIALQCSEADAHMILSENNSAARLLTRPGEAIYNNANGLVEGNNPFQVAWLNDDQRDVFLDRVEEMAKRQNGRWGGPLVFEGNLPANPLVNDALCNLVESSRGAAPEPAPRAWLGDSVAMSGPSEIRFFPRSGSNFLLVGQDSQSALGVMTSCLSALVAQHAPRIELFTEPAVGVHHGGWDDFLRLVPNTVHVVNAASTESVLSDFTAELTRRQESPGEHPPWFLVIDDLSRYRELRKSDDDFSFGFGGDKNKKASPGSMFSTLVKDGPGFNLHCIIWCDSYNNVDRWFSRQMLREFEMRAIFQMSAADSSNLIDSPAAARLGNNRALLYSDERGTMEKFRPYSPPTEEWLSLLKEHLPQELKSAAASETSVAAEAVPADQSDRRASGETSSAGNGHTADNASASPPAPPPITGEPTSASNGHDAPPEPSDVADDLSAFKIT